MRPLDLAGLGILTVGVLSIWSFSSVGVNPDFNLGVFGVLSVTLGLLVLASRSYSSNKIRHGPPILLAAFGWSVLSAGMLVAVYGYLLSNQVACSCPSNIICSCGPALYGQMALAGSLTALGGAFGLLGSATLSRRPDPERPARRPWPGPRASSALAVSSVALVIFGAFSYWPGVYVTSVYTVTQYPQAVQVGSPTAFCRGGDDYGQIRLGIGGTFNYLLSFASQPGLTDYNVTRIGVGQGFSITGLNTTLPLKVTSQTHCVTVEVTVRVPFYPYYGAVGFEVAVDR